MTVMQLRAVKLLQKAEVVVYDDLGAQVICLILAADGKNIASEALAERVPSQL